MLSRVRLLVTPWTLAHQTSLSMEFFRQEYGVGCHFLLQGIFPTKGSNPYLLHWQAVSLPLSQQGGPIPQSTKLYFNGKERWGSGCVLHHTFHF